jgi:ATP-dependent DNA helicase DinG
MGKASYISPDKVRELLRVSDTYDSETVQLLEKLRGWSKPLVEFEEEYGELPTLIKPDMVTFSFWDDIQNVNDIRREALNADFIVTTHAMVMIDCLCNHGILGDKRICT